VDFESVVQGCVYVLLVLVWIAAFVVLTDWARLRRTFRLCQDRDRRRRTHLRRLADQLTAASGATPVQVAAALREMADDCEEEEPGCPDA